MTEPGTETTPPAAPLTQPPRPWWRHGTGAHIVIGCLIVVALAAVYFVLSETGVLAFLMDRAAIEASIAGFGAMGPVAVVALMTIAIVISPIPSAPIALAAGAAYGPIWGSLYVLLGAELGALVAFAIARIAGGDVLHRWFGENLSMGLLGSQNNLMAIVFASRLLPFISFDLVSYAAGLTPLTWLRFAIATLVGIIPASFMLAHFGYVIASGEGERIAYSIIALGALTLVPVAVRLLMKRRKRRDRD
ncbi:MAG: VTT domain-containing protein [Alphaproteobacteria bacterium]